ncbi:hypothetical protein F5884DRAFT_813011, partial [Xylogone sp. PMI_703]
MNPGCIFGWSSSLTRVVSTIQCVGSIPVVFGFTLFGWLADDEGFTDRNSAAEYDGVDRPVVGVDPPRTLAFRLEDISTSCVFVSASCIFVSVSWLLVSTSCSLVSTSCTLIPFICALVSSSCAFSSPISAFRALFSLYISFIVSSTVSIAWASLSFLALGSSFAVAGVVAPSTVIAGTGVAMLTTMVDLAGRPRPCFTVPVRAFWKNSPSSSSSFSRFSLTFDDALGSLLSRPPRRHLPPLHSPVASSTLSWPCCPILTLYTSPNWPY